MTDEPEATYAYKRAHGIGNAGEVARVAARRRAATPGTYRYNANHGIGGEGERALFAARKRDRLRANARDQATLDTLIAEVEGWTHGPFTERLARGGLASGR